MCVVTEQPSGQLQKQHQYKQITPNKTDTAKLWQKEKMKYNAAAPSVKRHS
jgi:hypothetical protein